MSINKKEIIDTFNLFRSNREEITEVRVFSNRTLSGYYGEPDKLAEDIARYDGNSPIYFTLNKVNSTLINRAANKLVKANNSTSDSDIILRNWLLIDLDPIRPSGISSSDEEFEAAQDLAEEIANIMIEKEDFPEPVIASSGNGIHLLYCLELDNTRENTELIKNVLRTLDFYHSTKKVKVDTSAYSASQLTRFYGTVNCKGSNTKERPHRKSEILMIPEEIEEVDIKKLREFTNNAPEIIKSQKASSKKNYSPASTTGNFDLKGWIDKHDLSIAKTGPWEGGTRYILENCPWRDHSDRRSAYIIEFDSGALAAGCHHDSCSKENWFSLREKLDPEYNQEDSDDGFNFEGELEENSQINKLLNIIENLEFFLDELEEPHIVLPIESHKELWHYESHKVEQYLYQEYLKRHNTVPNTDSMNTILKIIVTKAHMSGNKKKLYRRVGKDQKGNFYYDLCDENWRAIKIEPGNIELVDQQPMIFTRNKNMMEQVTPNFDLESPAASLAKILKHVTLEGSGNQLLYQVYLVASLVPDISSPVLVIFGQKGSAKSTFLKVTKHFVDPARMDLLTMPNSKKDMIISLENNYFTCYDNLSSLSKMKSDLLCIASTGGAFSTRTLYTTKDETIMSFKRPVAINGINLVTTEPDLIDRSIIFELERIKENKYTEDSKIWSDYQSDLPEILGGAILILSKAMEIYPEVKPEKLGRMAEFTKIGFAISKAMGIGGDVFLKAYFANQDGSNLEVVESHPLAAAMVKLMEKRKELKGTVAEILNKLISVARKNSISTDADQFPGSASALSRRLKEVKSNLEDVGIYYEKKKKSRAKILTITNKKTEPVGEVPELKVDQFSELNNDNNDDKSESISLDME